MKKEIIKVIFWGLLTTMLYKAFGWWGIAFEVLIILFGIIIWWDDIIKKK